MKTEFVLVRHGETSYNRTSTLQGQLQIDLNETGIWQAHLAGEALKGEHFDQIYSSDLSRAFQTAQIIARLCGFDVNSIHAVPELREWNLGVFQGLEWKEIVKKNPIIQEAFSSEVGDVEIPGGERRLEFHARIHAFLDQMIALHEGKRILLVSHGGCSRAIFKKIMGIPGPQAKNPMTSNASISRFHFEDGFWQLYSWNEVSHIQKSKLRETLAL